MRTIKRFIQRHTTKPTNMKLPTVRRCGAVGSMLPPRASSWIIMAGRYRCQECGFYSTVEEASVVDSLKSEAQNHLKFIPQHSPLRTEKACGLTNKPPCRRECLRVPPPLPLPREAAPGKIQAVAALRPCPSPRMWQRWTASMTGSRQMGGRRLNCCRTSSCATSYFSSCQFFL